MYFQINNTPICVSQYSFIECNGLYIESLLNPEYRATTYYTASFLKRGEN